jgi:hypothetical protein
MARHDQEIEKEIQRIEGQLLVAKQICRENVWIIIYLKKFIFVISLSLKK